MVQGGPGVGQGDPGAGAGGPGAGSERFGYWCRGVQGLVQEGLGTGAGGVFKQCVCDYSATVAGAALCNEGTEFNCARKQNPVLQQAEWLQEGKASNPSGTGARPGSSDRSLCCYIPKGVVSWGGAGDGSCSAPVTPRATPADPPLCHLGGPTPG